MLESTLSWYKKTRSLCIVEFLDADNCPPRHSFRRRLMGPVFDSSTECFFEILIASMEELLPSIHATLASRTYTSLHGFIPKDRDCAHPIFLVGNLLSSVFPVQLLHESTPLLSYLLKRSYCILREDVISLCYTGSKGGVILEGSPAFITAVGISLAGPARRLQEILRARGVKVDAAPVGSDAMEYFYMQAQPDDVGEDPWGFMLAGIYHLRQERKCMNIACSKSLLEVGIRAPSAL